MDKPVFSRKINEAKTPFPLPKLAQTTTRLSDIQLARTIYLMLEAMALRGVDIAKDLAQLDIIETTKDAAGLTTLPGLGGGAKGNARRIGGLGGSAPDHQSSSPFADMGFKDPLAGRSNQHHRSVVVGPASLPHRNDLSGQDTSYGNGSSSSHGSVWQERSTERQSSDGSQTWGSASYRDYGGNHWRVDYHDERHDDGSISSKETVFDGNNEPIKTTVREGNTDGTATETTTTHETGEVNVRTGTVPEIFPERSQTGEGIEARGSSVAPRGWYNPITGAIQNPGLATGNNQVNPGSDPMSPPEPSSVVHIDPRILVVNPAPDQPLSSAQPRDIHAGNPTIIDPPRP